MNITCKNRWCQKSCVHDNHHLLLSSTSSAYYHQTRWKKLTMFEFRMLFIICHKRTQQKQLVAHVALIFVVSICEENKMKLQQPLSVSELKNTLETPLK